MTERPLVLFQPPSNSREHANLKKTWYLRPQRGNQNGVGAVLCVAITTLKKQSSGQKNLSHELAIVKITTEYLVEIFSDLLKSLLAILNYKHPVQMADWLLRN